MTFILLLNDPLFGSDFRQNSMNVKASCRKRSLSTSMLKFQALSCDVLREMLIEKNDYVEPILVLDCRSFFTYNDSHILSAVNAHCPSILRRRSRGKLPFHVLIPSKDIREKLQRGFFPAVVLYEECSPPTSSPISGSGVAAGTPIKDGGGSSEDFSSFRVVARAIQQEGFTKSVYFLEGGFSAFRQKYPQFCVESHQAGCKKALMKWESSGERQFHSTNPFYEQGDPVEILSYVYLGSASHAANQKTLERLHITALLNVSRTCPNLSERNLHYKCIPVDDSGNAEISSWFHEAINYIDEVRSSGGKVLIHCHAGISRSATICLAYLMTTKRIRLEEAYEYVKKRRNVISPNLNFMGQLLKYESQLGLFSPSASSARSNGIVGLCNNTVTNFKSGNSSPASTSPLHNFVAVMAAAAVANSKENCLLNAQRFVFDLAAKEDGYSGPPSTPILSPMCTTPNPILSPS